MNPYVKKVKPLDNYCLMLWLENGEQKILTSQPEDIEIMRVIRGDFNLEATFEENS